MNRIEAVAAYKINIEAQAKVQRNANKLAWMAYQSNAVDFHAFNMKGDMERYIQEAKEAAANFAAAVEGATTEEIVSIIMQATTGA